MEFALGARMIAGSERGANGYHASGLLRGELAQERLIALALTAKPFHAGLSVNTVNLKWGVRAQLFPPMLVRCRGGRPSVAGPRAIDRGDWMDTCLDVS